jgi:3-dehydroquinate synthetase
MKPAIGLCAAGTAARVERHLAAVGLPTRIADIAGGVGTAHDLVRLMGQDKKVRDGALTFILVRGIGQAYVAPGISAETVAAFLDAEMSGAGQAA